MPCTLKADICTVQCSTSLSPSLPVFHFHTVSLARLCVLCDAAALQAPPWRDSGATQLREREGDAGKKAVAVVGEGRGEGGSCGDWWGLGSGGGGVGILLENPVQGRVASVH